MNTIRATALTALAAALLFAAPASAKDSSQQNKMKDCNVQAKGKTGDDRKSFMKECLSAKPAAKELTPQQQKMKDCNASAAGKKGAERKAFMSDCLKKK